MYLAPEINATLQKNKFQGIVKYDEIRKRLQRSLSKWGVKVVVNLDQDIYGDQIACSGTFDTEVKKKPIELMLHFSKELDDFEFTPKSRKTFDFLVSQVLQHEMIHQCQYNSRPFEDRERVLYYDVKAGKKGNKEHMDYLAELDEIDCYAHDIAMEIKHYYPKMDPIEVLRTINKRRKLWSWHYYRDTFRHSPDWSEVHNRLLKKVYQWLPHVH